MGQSSIKINLKNEHRSITGLNGDNNNIISDNNYKGAENTHDTNASRQSKMQPIGYNKQGSDRRTETPGVPNDEDNFLSFGDTGAFDKHKRKYPFGSNKQVSRGKNSQYNELSNSRKDRVN